MQVFQEIAIQLERLANGVCMRRGDIEDEALRRIKELEDRLPHGSGFDIGVKVLVDRWPKALVLKAPFHCLDEWGGYLSWEEYEVKVVPTLRPPGFDLVFVKGKHRDGLKDYVGDCLFEALIEEA